MNDISLDALAEARQYFQAGEGIGVSSDDVLSITSYLAGINAALIAIAERLPAPSEQEVTGWEERQAAKDSALPVQHTRGRSKLFKT